MNRNDYAVWSDEDAAREKMRAMNRPLTRGADDELVTVLVEGPCNGEWMLMSLIDAVVGGFAYSWDSGR